jgi:hypothetical protein
MLTVPLRFLNGTVSIIALSAASLGTRLLVLFSGSLCHIRKEFLFHSSMELFRKQWLSGCLCRAIALCEGLTIG